MNLSNFLDNNIIYGENSLLKLEDQIINNNYKNILLISGNTSFRLSGAEEYFNHLKSDIKIFHLSYSGIAVPIEDVNLLYDKISNISDIDLIIGIGGGTILDITKIISLLYSNNIRNIDNIISGKKLENMIDIILIPTTAGSGSESTSFAVIYKNKIKYSIDSANLNIQTIILDPNLLNKIPADVLKISLLDSLSQAIESIWSKNATIKSYRYAKASLEILYENLFEKETLKNHAQFLIASHLAGKAINLSKTTAPHAISYPLTSYFNIPHGLAVFLTLIPIINFNYYGIYNSSNNQILKTKLNTILKIFKCENVNQLSNVLRHLLIRFGFSEKLSNYNILSEHFSMIIKETLQSARIKNNPIKLTENDLKSILSSIL